MKEVAWTVMRETGFSRRDVSVLAMQETILEAQIRREGQAALFVEQQLDPTQKLLLSDRSAIDPVIYACITAPTDEDAHGRKKALFARQDFSTDALPRYKAPNSRFFLLRPVEGWLTDDGVSSLGDHAR